MQHKEERSYCLSQSADFFGKLTRGFHVYGSIIPHPLRPLEFSLSLINEILQEKETANPTQQLMYDVTALGAREMFISALTARLRWPVWMLKSGSKKLALSIAAGALLHEGINRLLPLDHAKTATHSLAALLPAFSVLKPRALYYNSNRQGTWTSSKYKQLSDPQLARARALFFPHKELSSPQKMSNKKSEFAYDKVLIPGCSPGEGKAVSRDTALPSPGIR